MRCLTQDRKGAYQNQVHCQPQKRTRPRVETSFIPNMSFLESTHQQHLSRGKCPAGAREASERQESGKESKFFVVSKVEQSGERTGRNEISTETEAEREALVLRAVMSKV